MRGPPGHAQRRRRRRRRRREGLREHPGRTVLETRPDSADRFDQGGRTADRGVCAFEPARQALERLGAHALAPLAGGHLGDAQPGVPRGEGPHLGPIEPVGPGAGVVHEGHLTPVALVA